MVVASALVLGVCKTFAPWFSGQLLPIAFAVLLTISSWRKYARGPYIFGAGVTGVWSLLSVLTNTDPALTYPIETGIASLVGFATAALGGAVVTLTTLRQ